MSLTEADWLRQIAANRDDDAIRLVFADWLEEQGDAVRAEFIRVQVRLAALPENAPERAGLTRREKELLTEYCDAWLVKVPKELRKKCRFRRGFVSGLRCTARQWLRSAKCLQQACPLLEALRLPPHQPAHLVENLVSSPHVDRLTTLELLGEIDDAGVSALAAPPYLGRLTTLSLWSDGINAAGASALASSPLLSQLTTLDLSFTRIGDAGAAALASSPHLPRLTKLCLWKTGIGTRGAAALAASPHLPHLATLDLGRNDIDADGAAALASSPHLARLATLDLAVNENGYAGTAALAYSPHLARLTMLDLRYNRIGDMGRQHWPLRRTWVKSPRWFSRTMRLVGPGRR
jgi:uncharacterized protein (TIGR02996 family)